MQGALRARTGGDDLLGAPLARFRTEHGRVDGHIGGAFAAAGEPECPHAPVLELDEGRRMHLHMQSGRREMAAITADHDIRFFIAMVPSPLAYGRRFFGNRLGLREDR